MYEIGGLFPLEAADWCKQTHANGGSCNVASPVAGQARLQITQISTLSRHDIYDGGDTTSSAS